MPAERRVEFLNDSFFASEETVFKMETNEKKSKIPKKKQRKVRKQAMNERERTSEQANERTKERKSEQMNKWIVDE